MGGGHECGSRVRGDVRVTPCRGDDRTDRAAEGGGVLKVRIADVADAPLLDLRRRHAVVAEVAQQHAQLLDGIVTIEVLARVRFRVAGALGTGQRGGEIHAVPRHAREDEVAGPVHDALDRGHRPRQRPALEGAKERDPGQNAGLVEEWYARPVSRAEQLIAVHREQRLVRRHDGQSRVESGEHECPRRLQPAQHFDDDVGVGREGLKGIAGQTESGDIEPARAPQVADQRGGDGKPAAGIRV